jgi:hypothetical protein
VNIRRTWLSNLATIFPYVLFLIAIAAFFAAYIIGETTYALKSLIFVIPVIISAIILLFKSHNNGTFLFNFSTRIRFVHIFLITILLFIISLILLVSLTTRPWSYFIIISLMVGLIFLQIYCERSEWTDYLIIIEVVSLSLDLTWGVSLKYPLYFADTDILYHLNYINMVINTDHISGFGVDYINFPLFHIFNAIGVELTNLSLKNSYFILSGITWQIGIIISYLIFKKFSNSGKFSLIACLILAASQQIIFYGMYSITRSMAFVLALSWLYVILGKPNIKKLFLSFIIMAALILTHHTTVLFLIPVMVVVYIFQKLFGEKSDTSEIQLLPIELLIICFFSYIVFNARQFSDMTIPMWFQAIFTNEHPLVSLTWVTTGSPITSALNAVYFSFALLFSLIGIGATFKKHDLKSKYPIFLGIALASLIFLIFFIYGPSDLIPQFQNALLYRIALIVSPFIMLVITSGIEYCGYISNYKIFKRSGSAFFLVSVLLILMTFFSVIGGANATDNNYVLKKSNKATGYFTNSELDSFMFINDKCDVNSNLYSDWSTIRNEFYLSSFTLRQIIKDGNLSNVTKGYVVFRYGELERTEGLTLTTTGFNSGIYRYNNFGLPASESDIAKKLASKSRIYSDDDVQIYVINQ